MLQAGGLAALGLSLPQLWAARAAASTAAQPAGFGRAKRCIFLFMWGGPSQLDTFDTKPDAPAEVRGPFKPISTRVPGLQICEHFQRLSNLTDKLAVIRSLAHDDPAHLSSGHLALTGHLAPTIKSDAAPPSDRDSPHLGALLARIRAGSGDLPPFVTLPWMAYHPAAPAAVRRAKRAAGWAVGTTRCWLSAIRISPTGRSKNSAPSTASTSSGSTRAARCSALSTKGATISASPT